MWWILYLVGSLFLIYLFYSRWKLHQSNACVSCTSSMKVQDNTLTREECDLIIRGDRTLLQKLGKGFKVKQVQGGDLGGIGLADLAYPSRLSQVVFLNEDYSGGEVIGDGQIVFPITGRKVIGNIKRIGEVRLGEQYIAYLSS